MIQYHKLEELGLTAKLKTIHIEGEDYFDVHDTDKGKVWFKITNPNNSRFNKKIIDNSD